MSPLTYLTDTTATLDFDTYLAAFKKKLQTVFKLRGDADELGLQRGLPPYMLREVQSMTPLSVCIPEAYGGRGVNPAEYQSLLEAASYESLALSLTIGINGALFLQPVAKYGTEEVQQHVFERFIEHKQMGGLMITEPDHGTDALRMQTSFEQGPDDRYHLEGIKHWGGLTGWADFWLVTAREQRGDGSLGRDIGFFVADMNDPQQTIEVEEVYRNLGLYIIPYGRNRIDISVPESHRLVPDSTGLKMMLDTLHRSRTQFPGMGMGFLRRMMDEAVDHCRERFVGGKPLIDYDQVKSRIARLQAYFTTCSALCLYAGENAQLENNMAGDNLPANAIKSVVTDFMQEASDSLLQLTGAKGYRLDHIAGRSYVDSRPFQIFEGSNDILYQQITESVLKQMRRLKETNLYRFLSDFEMTARSADRFQDVLDFEVDLQMPQRKLVELGKVLGRIITMEMTVELGARGFHEDLVANAMHVLKHDVDTLVTAYRDRGLAGVVEDYMDDSSWLACLRPSN